MTDTTKDGGPAFPITGETSDAVNAWPFNGMTLRDYFAGQALAGLCSNPDYSPYDGGSLARVSFERADAILKAREET